MRETQIATTNFYNLCGFLSVRPIAVLRFPLTGTRRAAM